MRNRDVEHYAIGSKILHWLIAVLVILMLSGGFFMEDLDPSLKPLVYMLHKSIGLSILGLMFIRLGWIIHHGKPQLPRSVSRIERILSHAVQHSFYLLLFLMPLSGWILSTAAGRSPVYFGLMMIPFPGIPLNDSLAELMKECHEVIAYILIGLIVLHISGALKHHWIDKDGFLRRMFW